MSKDTPTPAVLATDLVTPAEAQAPPELNERQLLSFYDGLRHRVLRHVEKKAGKLGKKALQAFMVIPDVFILLVRLALDREVPERSRALIGGALLYFVMPFDLWPEMLAGPAGYMDDLVLAVAVLGSAFDPQLEHHALRHWSGSRSLHSVLQHVTTAGHGLLGEGLYGRLRRVLARRGIPLRAPIEPATTKSATETTPA